MALTITTSTRHFLTLAEVKAHLDKSSGADDAELYRHRNVAEEQVQRIVGPIVHRTVTELATVRGGTVYPSQRPLVSVTSATVAGVALAGVTAAGPQVSVPTLSRGTVLLTYVAGRTEATDSMVLAAAIIAKHLWRSQQGAAPASFADGDEELVPTPFGFAIPRRASDLLEADALPPVVA